MTRLRGAPTWRVVSSAATFKSSTRSLFRRLGQELKLSGFTGKSTPDPPLLRPRRLQTADAPTTSAIVTQSGNQRNILACQILAARQIEHASRSGPVRSPGPRNTEVTANGIVMHSVGNRSPASSRSARGTKRSRRNRMGGCLSSWRSSSRLRQGEFRVRRFGLQGDISW